MGTHDAELDEVATLARHLAAAAATLLLERQASPGTLGTKTSLTDLVSEVDRASEQLIVDAVRQARPGDGIVGEEGAAHDGTSGWRWVIDPLDGTINYLYGLPSYAVSIAVERHGRAEVGVVAQPAHRETFSAIRGQGATCEGVPITASAHDDLATALVGTGFSYEADRRSVQAALLARVLPAVRDIRRAGAASVDLCWVACGRLDGYYEHGLQPWDFAAGALIATEAGARTGDLDGATPSGDFTMAAAPALFESLRQLLVDAGARASFAPTVMPAASQDHQSLSTGG
ncbi:MAG: inositol monophosphatase [Actinobacteria bacterium]|nr:inositol monophosphatase [Actinomycetota bacterium]